MAKIKVIVKRPDEPIGHVCWISNTLENHQNTVGGYIEVVPADEQNVIICNEEGKLQNDHLVNFKMPYNVIVGTVIVCGVFGEEFSDTTLQKKDWKDYLKKWGNET